MSDEVERPLTESAIEQFQLQCLSKSQIVSSVLQILKSNPHVLNFGEHNEVAFNSCLVEILGMLKFSLVWFSTHFVRTRTRTT